MRNLSFFLITSWTVNNVMIVIAPLLLEMMAFGALYTREPAAARQMHTAALQLLSEVRTIQSTDRNTMNSGTWLFLYMLYSSLLFPSSSSYLPVSNVLLHSLTDL